MAGVYWKPAEDAILRDLYLKDLAPHRRMQAYRDRLPGRTSAAIHARAAFLEITHEVRKPQRWAPEDVALVRREWGKTPVVDIAQQINRHPSSVGNLAKRLKLSRKEYKRIKITPVIDDAIRAAYASTQRGFCKRVAEKIGATDGWVKQRARALGLTRVQKYVAKWTDEENAILDEYYEKGGVKYIASKLKAAGFTRSLTAIEQQVHTLGLSWRDRDVYTPRAIAEGMGVNHGTVIDWITAGLLKAKRETFTGLHDSPSPKTYLVQPKNVRRFLIEHIARYRLSSVDRYWFVSILAGDDVVMNIQHSAGKGSTCEEEYGVAA